MGVEVVLRIHIKLIITFFLVMSVTACKAYNNKERKLISVLETSFEFRYELNTIQMSF